MLDRLLMLRDELALMKQDRSTYVKSSEVVQIYTQVVDQVRHLNTVRTRERKPLEQNRLDYVLDDCFQLISLFFLACGKNDEIPALYAESSTLKRLLDHLKEAAFYSGKDLQGLHLRIDDMATKLRSGKCEGPECEIMSELLEHRLEACAEILSKLEGFLATLHPSLLPTWEKLVAILRSLSACNTRSNFPKDEVQGLKEELDMMQSQMVGDKFVAPDGTTPDNQELALGLMRRCQLWCGVVEQKKGKIDERFKETWDKLKAIRDKLEKLSLTQAWSLRETDLWQFQRALDRVDEQRVEGNFVDAEGQPADLHANRTLLYLLRKSYSFIYLLIVSSMPVSEALLPIYNQLQTTKRCLLEVQRSGGVSSARELYPYSMKLNSIDNMRVDGKFVVGQDIPEGQAQVNALLAECYELQYKLRIEAENEDSD